MKLSSKMYPKLQDTSSTEISKCMCIENGET